MKHHSDYSIDNGAFERGKEQGVFLEGDGEELYHGICIYTSHTRVPTNHNVGAVWPGLTVFPDWFNPDTQSYWNSEFSRFFSSEHGVDIDGLWIDMNEASNFCPWPCKDPAQYSKDNDLPPAPPAVRSPPRPIPGFPEDFQPPKSSKRTLDKRRNSSKGSKAGLLDRDLIDPPYKIANAAGSISNKTIDTDVVHAGGEGYVEYDTHNLYGTSKFSQVQRIILQIANKHSDELCISRSNDSASTIQTPSRHYTQHIRRRRYSCWTLARR